jgi:biotin carboxyl carrier protein
MLKIFVNKDKGIDFKTEGGKIYLNNEILNWDISKNDNNHYHIIESDRSYNAEVIKADYENKTFKIRVNSEIIDICIKDKFDDLLEKLGMQKTSALKIKEIKAPMPGLIIDIKVNEGTLVKTGEPLMILEAMKMENILKSPTEGTIKSIKVKKGDSVEKNQILIQF